MFKDGKQIDTMYPAKWFFRKHEEEPTTETAIRRTFAEDLYLVLAFQPSDLAAQSASLQIVINPLVNWIWFGFAVMAIGTGIALLPERTLRVRAGEDARGGDRGDDHRGAAPGAVAVVGAAAGPDGAGTGIMLPPQERARRADAGRDGLHLRRLRARAAVASVRAGRPTRCAASCGRRSIKAGRTKRSSPTSSR